jgi:hypothetical protein
MIAIPNTRTELLALEKANNVIVKINGKGNMSGLVPAYKKVSIWVGYKDSWEVYFIAAKQYHTLLDNNLIASFNYDRSMVAIKSEYKDYCGRVAKIFKTEKEALNYLAK